MTEPIFAKKDEFGFGAGKPRVPKKLVAKDPPPQTPSVSATDWPWWRGPSGDGHATAEQTPPLSWSPDEGVLWKQPIPGRGHAAPTVVGDAIYLPTADRERDVQTVLCLDRASC